MTDWADRVATAEVLLVAVDFDGTLAPLAARPDLARPHPSAVPVLQRLAETPGTVLAVTSGRPLADLAARAPWPHDVILVGSHGGERARAGDGPRRTATAPLDSSRMASARRAVDDVVRQAPGVYVEEKPTGVAVHVRGADPDVADEVLTRLAAEARRLAGVELVVGKAVGELRLVGIDLGKALAALRRSSGATCVLYLGDDATDEDAFAALGRRDVGVKVGAGPTRARHRVQGVAEAVELLARIADVRARP